LLLARAPV